MCPTLGFLVFCKYSVALKLPSGLVHRVILWLVIWDFTKYVWPVQWQLGKAESNICGGVIMFISQNTFVTGSMTTLDGWMKTSSLQRLSALDTATRPSSGQAKFYLGLTSSKAHVPHNITLAMASVPLFVLTAEPQAEHRRVGSNSKDRALGSYPVGQGRQNKQVTITHSGNLGVS